MACPCCAGISLHYPRGYRVGVVRSEQQRNEDRPCHEHGPAMARIGPRRHGRRWSRAHHRGQVPGRNHSVKNRNVDCDCAMSEKRKDWRALDDAAAAALLALAYAPVEHIGLLYEQEGQILATPPQTLDQYANP